METELIRAFIVVAENLSFTRAAEKLDVAQPFLSRAMRRLEDVVGEDLFDRSSRQIRLTPSGMAFLDDAQDMLDMVSSSVQHARAAGRGAARTLRVGYQSSFIWQSAGRGIHRFRERHPDVTLDLKIMSREEETARLRSGELDVGLIDNGHNDRSGLSWRQIGQNKLILAIPSSWGMNCENPMSLSAMRDKPFVLTDPKQSPDLHSFQRLFCEQAGFEPIVVGFSHDVAETRFLVAAGLAAAFMFETSFLMKVDGVDLVPLLDSPEGLSLNFHVIWAAKRKSGLVRDFVHCMIDEAHVPQIVRSGKSFAIEWVRANFDQQGV